MTAKIFNYTKDKVLVDGDIGIEIEVEPKRNAKLPIINNTHWQTKEEGSLRNGGQEYVTKGPLNFDSNFMTNIESLTNSLRKVAKENNYRTSVHVHVNMTNKSLVQTFTVLTSYWLLENLLFKYCGEDRESNNFCLRLKDAEGVVTSVENSLNYSNPIIDYTDNLRYGGVNLNALWKFGSLEFRGMRGTISPTEIYDWASTLHTLSEWSIKLFSNPKEVMDYYYDNSWKNLVNNFTVRSVKDTCLKIKDAEELVDENAYRLIGMTYKMDWKKYQENMNFNLKKKLNSKKAQYSISDEPEIDLTFPYPYPIYN